jgi:hypothetical protein
MTQYVLRGVTVPAVVQVTVLLLVAAVVSVIFVSYWARRSMPSEDYARIMIGGRPPSETLQVISQEVESACSAFLTAEQDLTNPNPKHVAIDKLKREFAWQHRALLNISALIELASQELDVTLSRLRDHVFEYDPAMHRKYFQRAIQNAELLSDLNDNEVARRATLLEENQQIFKKAKQIVMAQKAIRAYASILPRVLQVAATHSTSDATGRYASAVSYVADQVRRAVPASGRWRTKHKARLLDAEHFAGHGLNRRHDGVAMQAGSPREDL